MAYKYNGTHCPGCGNHCPKESLRCKKGKKIFVSDRDSGQILKTADSSPAEKESQGLEDRLAENLKFCGKYLRHGGKERLGRRRILSILAQTGTMDGKNLRDVLGMDRKSADDILEKMENTGFIIHRDGVHELTAGGRKAAQDISCDEEKAGQGLFECLSDKEKEQLFALVDKLAENWSALG